MLHSVDCDEESKFIQHLFERISSPESELEKSRRLCVSLVEELRELRKMHKASMQTLTAKFNEVHTQLQEALESQNIASRQLESYKDIYEKLLQKSY